MLLLHVPRYLGPQREVLARAIMVALGIVYPSKFHAGIEGAMPGWKYFYGARRRPEEQGGRK